MQKFNITVVVDLYDEYLGEEDVEIEVGDEAYKGHQGQVLLIFDPTGSPARTCSLARARTTG